MSVLARLDSRLYPIAHLQLFIRPMEMTFDRPHRDRQRGRDFPVRKTAVNKTKHPGFALCQGVSSPGRQTHFVAPPQLGLRTPKPSNPAIVPVMVPLPIEWYRYHLSLSTGTTISRGRGLGACALDDRETDVEHRFGH